MVGRTPTSLAVENFCKSKQNESSRDEYRLRLLFFDRFCEQLGGTDKVVEKVKLFEGKKKGHINPYELLGDYYIYLLDLAKKPSKKKLSINTIKLRVQTATKCVEYASSMELGKGLLKNKIDYGRLEEREPYSLRREQIIKLLTTPFNTRLTVFLHFLLVVGCRPIEACRLKISDLDLNSDPPKVHFPPSITKIRRARTNHITNELANVLKTWLKNRERTRNKVIHLEHKTETGASTRTETKSPKLQSDNLLFAGYDIDPKPKSVCIWLERKMRELVVRTGLDEKFEDGIHKITFMTCRDFVNTQIRNARFERFAEYWIGHKGQYDYWTSRGSSEFDEQTRIDLFRKVQHLFIYLDKDEVLKITKEYDSKIEAESNEIRNLSEEIIRLRENYKKMELRVRASEIDTRLTKIHDIMTSSQRIQRSGKTIAFWKIPRHTNKIGGIENMLKTLKDAIQIRNEQLDQSQDDQDANKIQGDIMTYENWIKVLT